jgi:hypothetical protein
MAYNYEFMDEAKLKEIEELLAGEKGNALVAWSLECAKAGIDGYRHGLMRNGLIAAGGAVVAAGGYWIAKKVAKKHVEKRLEEAKKET